MNSELPRQKPIASGAGDLDGLSRRYSDVLIRYFQRRGIQRSDAQDLAQEVFVRLVRQEALDQIDNIEGYLFVMAGNVARDMFRKNKVRSDNRLDEIAENFQKVDTFLPDRAMESRQELDSIVAALNELPHRMRTIFILARLENMPRAEIAERVGVSKRTVELAITQATASLADRRRRLT